MKKHGKRLLIGLVTLVVILEGGNHAGFGDDGPQAGDGVATITAEEQWDQTTDLILNFMGL